MRLIPTVWCLVFVLIFNLSLGLSRAEDPGNLMFDLDWDGPPHQLDQRITAGTTSKSPSLIRFGSMYVRSSIGVLINRPLEMSQSEETYDQFWLTANTQATRYVLDFDMTHTGASSLAVFFDFVNAGLMRVDLHGNDTVSSQNATAKLTTATAPSGAYGARGLVHVQMEFDKGSGRLNLRINGVLRGEWWMKDVTSTFDISTVRFSSSGVEAIGLDNIQLRSYGSPAGVYIAPEVVDFGDALAGTSTPFKSVELVNPTTTPVTLTDVQSNSSAFAFVGGYQLPITVASGGRTTLSMVAKPAALGETLGVLTFRTSAGDRPVSVRVFSNSYPSFTNHPATQVVNKGENLVLTTTVSAPYVFRYEWTRNNVLVKETTTPTFTIPAAALTDAGSYRVTAVLLEGVRITSNPGHVAIVEAQQLSRTADWGSPLALTCQASGPSLGTLKYRWTFNAAPIASGPSGVLVNGNTLQISQTKKSHIGTYACWVTLENLGGGQVFQPIPTNTPTLIVELTAPEPPRITTTQLPTLQVGQAVNLQITTSTPVDQFAATGLPPGIVLNTITGQLTGTPTTAQPDPELPYQVEFSIWPINDEEAITKTLEWWVMPPLAAGNYAGHIQRDCLPDPDGQGGVFSLTVTGKGKISARLKVGRQSFSGVGQIEGVTQSGGYAALLNVKGLADPIGIFLLPHGRPATGEFPSQGGLTCWRVSTKEEASPFIGHFPTALEVPAPGGPGGGVGFIHLRVNRAGTATWSGVMPNGMPITGSHPLLQRTVDEVHLPLYWLPKGMKSSVLGWLALEGENVDGSLDWGYTQAVGDNVEVRENGIGDGFERCEIIATGSRHTPPPRGVILLGLDRVAQSVRLSPEGPRGVSMHGLIQVLPGHRVVVADPSQFPFPGMQIKINPTTSSFSGSYIATRLQGFPIRSTFQGIFESRTGEGLGVLRSVVLPEQPSGPIKLSSIRTQVGSIRITPYR